MPVVAVAVAIGASVVASSAVAATVGGIMAISAVTALEVVGAVGATISAIGAVTGNKALSYAGMAIGAVGAIGSFAASAGVLGASAASDAPLFGAAPADTGATFADSLTPATSGVGGGGFIDSGAWDNAASTAGAADAASADTVGFVAGNDASVAGDSTSRLASTAENAADPGAKFASAADTAPTNDTITLASESKDLPNSAALSDPAASASTPDLTSAEQQLPEPPQQPANLGATDPSTGKTITKGLDETGKEISLPDNSSIFGKVLAFAKDKPAFALRAVEGIGSLLEGMTSKLTPAQAAEAQARADLYNATAAQTRQQTATMAMPKAVASFAPVTGTPAPLVPTPANAVTGTVMGQPGFINQAKLPQVTGRPAAA